MDDYSFKKRKQGKKELAHALSLLNFLKKAYLLHCKKTSAFNQEL
jgi:hypothetical protein